MKLLRAALLVGLCLAIASPAQAEEEKIPLDKVPAKVKDAVKAKFPNAQMVSAEKETKDGKTSYEIAIKLKGKMIDVGVSDEGKILDVEAVIDFKDLPKTVVEALEKKYPSAKFGTVEEVTKDGKVSYEVVVEQDGKKWEVLLDKSGKIEETKEIKSKKQK